MENKARFAIIEAGFVADKFVPTFGGYHEMYRDVLEDRKSNEEWKSFKVYEGSGGRVPTADELDQYDAVLISGSKWSAYEDLPFINETKELIGELYARKKRMLGVCFGHQIIAAALGGVVKRATVGWELGVRNIQPEPNTPLFPEDTKQETPVIPVVEIHQDQVVSLPEDAKVLATSERCPIEMYQMPAEDPYVLCIQSHPEFTASFATELVKKLKTEQTVSEDVADAALETLDTEEVTPPRLKTWLRDFFHNKAS